MQVVVAVDAMGGYHAPGEVVEAVAEASHVSSRRDGAVYFVLVGDEVALTQQLNGLSHNPERIQLVHAPQVIGLGEAAHAALEHKPDASIARACGLVGEGAADVVVSAGHPGAAVLCARQRFELLPGVERAALAAVYPTPRRGASRRDRFSLILDVGASYEASAEELAMFARLGSSYARQISLNPEPRVALLSNSREGRVGPPSVVGAHELLRGDDTIHFIGAIEGHDIPHGHADVIVCEGFVGDVTIKLLEGVGEAAVELARSAYERKFVYRQGLRLLSGGLTRLKALMDFEEYGGAPLLGFRQPMILAHPRSGKRAIANALKLAIKNVRSVNV